MVNQKSRHFPVIVEKDKEGVFIVSCPSFRGCHSYGYTMEDAMNNIREAIELCLEDHTNTLNETEFIQLTEVEILA